MILRVRVVRTACFRLVLLAALAGALGACTSLPNGAARRDQAPLADGTRAELAILESTDIHTNMLSYDYYRLAEDPSIGFERMATLVVQTRAEFPNTLLFDAGDTIQGTPLADYQALVKPVGCDEELAIYARWTRSATTAARSAITSSTTACRFSRR